jgi:hypothetical protein
VKVCIKCGASDWKKSGCCRPCGILATRRWRKANRDKARAAVRRWEKAHPDKVRAYKAAAAKRNPEGCRRRSARYLRAHPEKCKSAVLAWTKAHPEKGRAACARRRARKRKALPVGRQKDPRVDALYFVASWLRKQGDDVHVDHIVPLAKGGLHVFENLQILPAVENMRKGARLP